MDTQKMLNKLMGMNDDYTNAEKVLMLVEGNYIKLISLAQDLDADIESPWNREYTSFIFSDGSTIVWDGIDFKAKHQEIKAR